VVNVFTKIYSFNKVIMDNSSLVVRSFTGAEALAYLDDLAALRIEVFREFPYLYDGDMASEREYLQAFLAAPDVVLVLAFDGDQVVGASTGLPMEHETPNIQAPFLQNGYDINKVFYYGESVLRKSYRGSGLGVAFFEHREAQARSLGRFEWVCFCGVIRPEVHPRRPADFIPLDAFWRKRGFERTAMICTISWKDLDEGSESPKALRFWRKGLV